MKKCPNCGASMDADVNFCTNCGTKLIEENINTSVEKTTRVEPVFQTPAQPQRMRSTSDRSVKMHNYWQLISFKEAIRNFYAVNLGMIPRCVNIVRTS